MTTENRSGAPQAIVHKISYSNIMMSYRWFSQKGVLKDKVNILISCKMYRLSLFLFLIRNGCVGSRNFTLMWKIPLDRQYFFCKAYKKCPTTTLLGRCYCLDKFFFKTVHLNISVLIWKKKKTPQLSAILKGSFFIGPWQQYSILTICWYEM